MRAFCVMWALVVFAIAWAIAATLLNQPAYTVVLCWVMAAGALAVALKATRDGGWEER